VDVVVLIVAGAAVALTVLWPTRAVARRLVLRWLGTGEPTAAQLDLARRDLWRRRAPLVVVAAVVFGTLASLRVLTNLWALVGGFLLSLLVCEVVAAVARRPVAGPPVRRAVGSLVPRYALVVFGGMTALTLLLVVAGFAVRPLVDRAVAAIPPEQGRAAASGWSEQSYVWVVLGWTVLVAVAVCVVVWLASSRVASADDAMDLALRTRAAGVATGLGLVQVGALGSAAGHLSYQAAVILTGWLPDGAGPIGAMGGDGPPLPRWLELSADVSPLLGLVMSLTGLVLWRWIASPPRPRPVLV
jgi:hypothetical protein